MHSTAYYISFAVLLAGMLGSPSTADEFRVETNVYVGSQKEPVAQNVTVFTDGWVYDFPLAGPEEITVFDPKHRRFILLDGQRKIRTTVTMEELLAFVSAIKEHASDVGGAFAAASNAEFDASYEQDTGWITLASEMLTYRSRGLTPESDTAVSRYQDFADWYARLNAVHPGGLPPSARLKLNAELADRRLIPQEVELTVEPNNRLLGRKLVVRSRHITNWRLSNTDRKRLEKAGDYMVGFQKVSFDEYRRSLDVASR